jgi:hypothetical protein
MDVTLSIPDHISAEDAQAVIAAFMAAQAAVTQAQAAATPDQAEDTDDVTSVDVILDDDEDEQDTTPEPDRSYVSVPSAGDIPSVTMSVGTYEGGIYGDVAAIRMAEEVGTLRVRMEEYRVAAMEAAQDPDRKRPPRAEPSLVDAVVRHVIGKMHLETATYMLDTSEGGYGSGYSDDSARISRSNEEQEHIGFVISSPGRRRTPHSFSHNHKYNNAWGLIDLITNEFQTEFTKAQVRASVKRLTDSGFLTEDGTCGKSARYRLSDISAYVKPTGA